MSNQSAIEYYNSGLQYAKEKKWDEAIEFLNKAIAEDPGHINSYNVLGKAYLQKDEVDVAKKYWRKALKIDPHNATARQCLATAGKESDRAGVRKLLWPAVVVILLAALIISNSIMLREISYLKTELNKAVSVQTPDSSTASEAPVTEKPQQEEPDNPPETSTNQKVHQEVPQSDPAKTLENEQNHRRLVILPKLETDWQVMEAYNQALEDCKSGYYGQAIEIFQRILKYLKPHDLKDNAQYWLAECYYAQKDYVKALAEFQKVKQYFPKANKVFDAELKVGYSYYKLGRIEEAKQHVSQLSKDWPKEQNRIVPLSKEIRSGQPD